MQVEFDVDALLPYVAYADSLVDFKDKRLIMRCALLETDPPRVLGVHETRMMDIRLPATLLTTIAHGRLLFEAKHFRSILQQNKGERVKLIKIDGKCKMTIGRRSFSVAIEDERDYPPIAIKIEGPSVQIPANTLTDMVGRAESAASKHFSAACMHGILLHLANGEFRVVGTDSSTMRFTALPVDSKETARTTVPVQSFQCVSALVDVSSDPVTLHFQPGGVVVTGPNGSILIRTFAGNYPAIDAVLARTYSCSTEVSRADLLGVLAQVALVRRVETAPLQAIFEADAINWTLETADDRFHTASSVAWPHARHVELFTVDRLREVLKSVKSDVMQLDIQPGSLLVRLNEPGLPYKSVCMLSTQQIYKHT